MHARFAAFPHPLTLSNASQATSVDCADLITKFLRDTFWGRMDLLVFDTPPGTSDEHLSGTLKANRAPSLLSAVSFTFKSSDTQTQVNSRAAYQAASDQASGAHAAERSGDRHHPTGGCHGHHRARADLLPQNGHPRSGSHREHGGLCLPVL
jgi:hypothetical protein